MRETNNKKLSKLQQFYLENSANMDAMAYLYNEEMLKQYGFTTDDKKKIEAIFQQLWHEHNNFLDHIFDSVWGKAKQAGFKKKHHTEKEVMYRALQYCTKGNIAGNFKFQVQLLGNTDSFVRKPAVGISVYYWPLKNRDAGREIFQKLYEHYVDKGLFAEKHTYDRESYDLRAEELGWENASDSCLIYREIVIKPAKDNVEDIYKVVKNTFDEFVFNDWNKIENILNFA